MRRIILLLTVITLVLISAAAFAEDGPTISFKDESYSIAVGKTVTLKAIITPKKNMKLEWSSSNEDVATVSKNGTVKGISVGETIITVKSADNDAINATCKLNVVIPVKSIKLSDKSVSMAVNTTWQLEATIKPENATKQDLIWTSSNNKIAIVSKTGVITGLSKGTVKITAAASDGSKVKAVISVKVDEYDLVFTSKSSQKTRYYMGNGRIKVKGSVKNGCVRIPDLSDEKFIMAMGGYASEEFSVTPVKAGVDTITVTAGSVKTVIKVFVSPEVFKTQSADTNGPQAVNLAENKPIYSDSDSWGLTPGNANDGSVDTYWESAGYPAELTVDLEEQVTISAVRLCLNPDPAWEPRTQTIELQISTDGNSYKQAVEEKEYFFDSATGNLIDIVFNPIETRYIKLIFTDGSWWNGAQVAEIQAYSKPEIKETVPEKQQPEEQFVNLAQNKPILCSTEWPNQPIKNASDGNIHTYWESKGYPAEAIINLIETKNISFIRIRLDPTWDSRNQTIEVLVSLDGENYTKACKKAKYTYNPGTGNTINIVFDAVDARYVKLVFTEGSWGNGAQAAEILIHSLSD